MWDMKDYMTFQLLQPKELESKNKVIDAVTF